MKLDQGHIPSGWVLSTIGDVCSKPQYGYTTKASQDGDLRLLRTTDITLGDINWESVPYCSENPSDLEKYLLEDGDLVISRAGSVGVSYLLREPEKAVFASYLIRFKPFVDKKYFKYFLESPNYWNAISENRLGIAVPNVNANKLKSISIPIPPREEQNRIVAKFEELFSELDKGVESLKTAREQLKVYRQAVLKHAFEGKLTEQWREKNKDKLESSEQLLARISQEREVRFQQQFDQWKIAAKAWEGEGKPAKKPPRPRKPQLVNVENVSLPELPNKWAWEYLGNLNIEVFDGPFGSHLKTSDYVDDGVRVIRLENIGYFEFLEHKHSYVTEEKYQSIKKHTVHSGDLIFSSFVSDGIRVVVLPEAIERAINKADCFCVRLHGETVQGSYLASFLSTRAAYKQVESQIHGIGRPRINTTQLKSFAIPLCSREEQDEIMSQISDKLSLADHIGATIEQELQQCEALRQSILMKAFSGQLVEQDPNDEPASVLLERIKAAKEKLEGINRRTKRKDAA